MLKKAKSIEQIYNECKDYDLVITNDAPLATALNKLVDSPRLEYLAMTPKQIASNFAQLYYEKLYEKYEVVLSISKLTKKPIKFIHQSIVKIYEVWMYNAKLEFAGQFLSEEENSLLKYINELTTIETAMENFNEDFYAEKKIAVIGEDLFSLLDLEVLPRRGSPPKKIDIFSDDEYKIEKTYLFPSTEQLIQNILTLVNTDNAEETAIVLDSKSDYLEILKVRLKEAGISIEIKNFLSDAIPVRNFISLVELSLRIDELKINEFIPIACEFNISINSFYSQYNVSNYMNYINTDENLKKLYDISKNILSNKYGDLLIELKNNFAFCINSEFDEVLNIFELHDAKINESNFIELKYFLKEFDVEISSVKSGVLFVNALNSAFIDRQLIFYVGMDNSWMKLFPDIDYLNKEDEEAKSIKRFQILLQQGKKRFYFVQNVKDYKEVIPCYYFLILSENDTETFNGKFFNPVIINNKKTVSQYKGKVTKFPVSMKENLKSISPSGFNKYFKCPKYYSFKKLFPQEDLPHLKKGNLLHNFAELYFNHPDYVKKNSKKILDIMVQEIKLLIRDANEEFIRSEFQIGTESIVRFLDDLNLHKMNLSELEPPSANQLMEVLNLKKIYLNTERWLADTENTMITGKIDLQAGNTVVDYKSSGRKNESTVTLQSNLDYINSNESTEFDFQAAAYIAALRGSFKEIDFIYNYIFANYKNHIDPSYKKLINLTRIKYIPVTFNEYIYSNEVFKRIGKNEKSGRLLEKLGYGYYKRILDNLCLKDVEYYDKDLLTKCFIEITNSVLEKKGLTYSTFRCKTQESLNNNFIKPVATNIHNIRTGKWSTGLIFRDDVDKFSALIKETLTDLIKYSSSKFPFEPLFGSMDICKDCDYLNLCIGNKLWH